MTDAEAFAHYDLPAARRSDDAQPRRLREQPPLRLSEYVPVRLDPTTLEAVRNRAAAENQTVSAWLRALVERELAAIRPPEDGGHDQLARLLEEIELNLGRAKTQLDVLTVVTPRHLGSGRLHVDVLPAKMGMWSVKRQGASRASSRHASRKAAELHAAEILLKRGGGVLVIRSAGGEMTSRPVEPPVDAPLVANAQGGGIESNVRSSQQRSGATMGEQRHVVKDGDGWVVKKPGAERASSRHDTQREADKRAAEILGRAGGGERITHGRDGRIRSKDTIAPGHDPNPPKDKEH